MSDISRKQKELIAKAEREVARRFNLSLTEEVKYFIRTGVVDDGLTDIVVEMNATGAIIISGVKDSLELEPEVVSQTFMPYCDRVLATADRIADAISNFNQAQKDLKELSESIPKLGDWKLWFDKSDYDSDEIVIYAEYPNSSVNASQYFGTIEFLVKNHSGVVEAENVAGFLDQCIINHVQKHLQDWVFPK